MMRVAVSLERHNSIHLDGDSAISVKQSNDQVEQLMFHRSTWPEL
jgi:hypothetical protein